MKVVVVVSTLVTGRSAIKEFFEEKELTVDVEEKYLVVRKIVDSKSRIVAMFRDWEYYVITE